MNWKRFLGGIFIVLVVLGGWLSWDYYKRIYKPNVSLETSSVEFFIHSDWKYEDVLKALREQDIVENVHSFDWVAQRKGYPDLVKGGKYIILDAMSNNALVNLLRSGEQEPVNFKLASVRTKAELAGSVSKHLEADSATLMQMLNDPAFCQQYGFNTTTIFTLFLPNTYQFYWNTTAEEFVVRMAREYKRFWNEERVAKAGKLGMSQSEVSTLASLVQAEQGARKDERPRVAGLYLNRIRKGMRLESDPTLIHAIGDFSIKRVLHKHKEIDSPYNTYKNTGLPPGPILLPETTSIDAVLNAEKNNYIFMCAREDFSGYHNFASNYAQHMANARRYQAELNKRKIYR